MSADTTINCRDCGQAFTVTRGEQHVYASRGFGEPSRCAARKAQRDSVGSYGGRFQRGGGSRSGGTVGAATRMAAMQR